MRARGFTLIEILVTVAVVALLAAIALPSYGSYVTRSKSNGATADLVALSLALENAFQKTLAYPTYTAQAIPAAVASRTGTVATDFSTWAPAQGASFGYSITSTGSAYTLTATGTSPLDCTLTLSSTNVRSASGSSCGFTSW